MGQTLANIFMGFNKLKVVPSFKNNLKYLRYVDDCFILVKGEKLWINFLIHFMQYVNVNCNVIFFTNFTFLYSFNTCV